MATSDQIIAVESGGDPNAKNPHSSASGPGQFLDSTWLATLKAHRPDIAQGQSDSDLLALKTDPVLLKQMVDAYGGDNQATLQKNGLPVTPGTTYLAHFAGPGGAVKVLRADPDSLASDILGPAVVKANPFLKGMTAQGLQAWAAKEMGTMHPQPGVRMMDIGGSQMPQFGSIDEYTPAPANAQAAGPASATRPQARPIFAPPHRSGPASAPPPFAQIPPSSATQLPPGTPIPAQAAPANSFFGSIPASQIRQSAPIFASPRKPIDLSTLRAMLGSRAPIFPQE
jgi:hypothetical protein